MDQGWGQVQLTKYSSTTNIYQVQVLVKYSFFFKKYLSTSSTFISSTSTSTSTHIKKNSKVRMDIQSRVNLEWTKYRDRVISWSGYMHGYMASRYIFTSSKKVTDYL